MFIPSHKRVTIYGLVDPRDPTNIRYIGKTERKIADRLYQHIYVSKKHKRVGRKDKWIQSLIQDGLKPEAIELFVTSKRFWEEVEKQFIKQYRADGYELLNIHGGGELRIKGETFLFLQKKKLQ